MVFAIPNWEDGNTKIGSEFTEKNKVQQQNGSQKKSPRKKPTPQNTQRFNGISDKSKIINKENKKLLSKQKENKQNHTTNSNKNKVLDISPKNKNFTPSDGIQTSEKANGVADTSNTKKQRKENTRKTKQETDNSNKIGAANLDTDKLDEVLLNAKKNKFNEALRKDDVEDLLFKEDNSPEKSNENRKKHEVMQQPPNQILETNGVRNKPMLLIKKQDKTINNKIVKAKNKRNNLTKSQVDKEVFKVKTANNIKEKNNNELVETEPEDSEEPQVNDKRTRQDNKKDKLKKMLKIQSNRNPINFNSNKLRERMLDRLKSAQFRFLNEKLYTSSGSEASELFQNDPTAFHNYHIGYQQQVKKWPVNPLDVIVKRIRKMPKSHLIADMGCGEAALARRVPHAVRSFDLVSAARGVHACDMAHTPLLTASVDAVVYCLALMGTELTNYLVEANRVLKTGGHLLIAEVESRFSDVNAFIKDVSRLGFKLQKLNSEHEVFFFMEFVKNQEAPVKKAKLPVLTLKPCIYKRR